MGKSQRLQTTEKNHIRLETIRNAAEIIVDYLAALPIFTAYNLNDQQHGSIDGKKKKTKRQILKSRHSPKYFGLDIGVVIMTMNLNNIPFVTNIIGANEHEGHFTYSMLKEKWPDLVPILVSLLSHETKQHIIVSKLSSHEYKSDVKEALWELNNILKSIHILKYIDDPEYRRNIRTALNRGEGYHQLLDKITGIGSGDFRGMSELEVEIWNECTRLIALIIIAYNMCMLSELYEIKVSEVDAAAIEFLR